MARRKHELERLRSAIPTPQAQAQNAALSDFNALRLVRVREQLEKLDRMIADEEDPQKLDRLASAQSRLSEQERILDGRPLPGSRRPREEGTGGRRSRSEAALLIEDAQVVALASGPVLPAGWEYDDPPGLARPTGGVLEATSEPVVPTEPPSSL
jgi:hypothetical protein